ncbi:MAG: tetratricopeptide repeat protein [Acidobacteriota bacterium]
MNGQNALMSPQDGAASGLDVSEAVRRSFGKTSWIVGPWQDLLLFVGTPLIILPVVLGASAAFSVEMIALVVASFGALGHHLPGMMRAYGDRGLFHRFKSRFIVAPLFLVTVCALFTVFDLHGLVLIAYMWGVWHGLMQTYGFIRIYDAKTGTPSAWTRRLDHWMCLVWFGAGVTLSPGRMYTVLDHFYRAGGPLLPGGTVAFARNATIALLIIVNVAFVWNLMREWRRGNPPNLLKILLMISSFGFWFYCSVGIGNILVGVALFEVFHDVQYLSIVWLFNRARVEKDPSIGEFTRFVFRRSGGMMGLYVGLVFAYGAINFVPRMMASALWADVLMGVLVASALLHFYYDSFIWKVHEKENREALGLKIGNDGGDGIRIPAWALSAFRWSFFVVPLSVLAVAQTLGVQEPVAQHENLARLMPGNHLALANYGSLLEDEGDYDSAVEYYRRSLEVRPDHAAAHYGLGTALKALGDLEGSERHLLQAIELDPEEARAFNNLGNLRFAAGEGRQAEAYYRKALGVDPRLFEAAQNLAELQRARGELEAAEAVYREFLATDDEFAPAHLRLALLQRARGELDAAVQHLEQAVELAPETAEMRVELGNTLGLRGDLEAAERQLRTALELDEGSVPARLALGIALERQGDLDAAAAQYRAADEAQPANPAGSLALGTLLQGAGDVDGAEAAFQKALEIAPTDAEVHMKLGVLYATSGRPAQAAEHYRKALDMRPDWALAHFNLANVLAVQERGDEAIRHYHRALELEPGMEQARANLAAVQRHLAGA